MSNPIQTPKVVQQPPGICYVSFSAEITPQSAEALLGVCGNLANARVPKVTLLLTTPGGSVMHGMTIYNVLRGMPFELTTHNVGAVNSIGNVIFLAGARRRACPHSTFMFHGVGFDVRGERFEEKKLRERLDSIRADQKKIGAVIADRTSLSGPEVDELFLEAVTRDTQFAIEKGIVHEISEVSITPGAPVHQLVFQR